MAATETPGAAQKRVLRVLALHGYRQNERSFWERTGALRKRLRGRADLITFSAPLLVPDPDAEPGAGDPDSLQDESRGWWFSNPEQNSFDAMEESKTCSGLEASLDTVAKAFSELGPFDGILGFSQGAALVAIICALKQQGDPRFHFDFAILVAGFKSLSTDHAKHYQQPITVPSLHVIGETDRVISAAMSQELVSHFENPVILMHSGGHYVPACAPQKKVYWEFLDKFLT
ncbi:esterase OVCA2 [Xenopus tropicalis]|uniref:Esterase OVCA2 n=1 Tax=Xenopus tropicalis TaxID=8364 RepID=A8E5P8_XENTR|eukprot:NP_001107711.1 esterase OVCA2 [Xenopus tropicalis]